MQLIPLTDSRVMWAGAISVHHTDEWSMPWRIPHDERELFPPVELQARTAMPAGVRLVFRSNTTTISGTVTAVPEMAPIDLCCDGELIETYALDGQSEFSFQNLANDDKLIELWLPQFGEFRLQSLAIDDGATLTGHSDRRPRWITYGSSITQCRTASSPTQTWPAIVARNMNLHLTCLGFGGQCHLDPMIARMIHDQPADFLSICAGINIYGGASLSPRTFRGALIGFIQIVRDAHPEIPFVVMSPIYSPPREETPNAVGFTLQAMRDEVAAAVDTLQRAGDPYLYYVNGLEIFSAEYTHLLPDALHPNAEGYKIMGQNYTEHAAKRFFTF